MSGVFQNIDPHPLTARRVCIPPPLVLGEDTLAGWRGGCGINILEDARHCSVLYICNYFVMETVQRIFRLSWYFRWHWLLPHPPTSVGTAKMATILPLS
jgi:hypothetical protein